MNDEALDHALREHYEGESLSGPRLRELKELARTEVRRGSGPAQRWLGWAAAAVLALGVAAWGAWEVGRGPGPAVVDHHLGSAIAWEIAQNHLKGYPVEFPAESYASIGRDLTELGFVPAEPRRLRGRGLDLLGSRACSLQGTPAAQIQLAAPDGRRLTLYEARLDTADGLEAPVRFAVDGLKVQIWREAELVFGLVEPVAGP